MRDGVEVEVGVGGFDAEGGDAGFGEGFWGVEDDEGGTGGVLG